PGTRRREERPGRAVRAVPRRRCRPGARVGPAGAPGSPAGRSAPPPLLAERCARRRVDDQLAILEPRSGAGAPGARGAARPLTRRPPDPPPPPSPPAAAAARAI